MAAGGTPTSTGLTTTSTRSGFGWWSSNSLSFSSYLGGVCFSSILIQPPSMRPTSFNGSENSTYFFVSRCLISQAIRRKNLSVSSLPPASCTNGNFLSLLKYPALNANSKISMNSKSILPRSRDFLGNFFAASSQNLYMSISLCTIDIFEFRWGGLWDYENSVGS